MNDDATADAALDAALSAGRAIVATAERRHAESVAAREAGAVIAALRQRVEETCLAELTRLATPQLVAAQDVARAAHTMAGRLLHAPTMAARAAAAAGDTHALQVLCASFGITLPESA
jgi:glutamyl-tRNA reductase